MAEAKKIDDRTYDLLFSIRRSVRYNNRRRRFYENWNAITVTAAALGGSSAATAFAFDVGAQWIPAIISAMVAILSAFDLGVGTASSGNLHSELARKFIFLEQQFTHGRNLTDEESEKLTRDRLEIEAGEPTNLHLLSILCHFELLRATGDTREYPHIKLRRRLFAQWLSQDSYAQEVASIWTQGKTSVLG